MKSESILRGTLSVRVAIFGNVGDGAVDVLNAQPDAFALAGGFFRDFEAGGRWRGFAVDDFFLLRSRGAIRAVAGLWDQSAFRQTRVLGYRGRWRLWRAGLSLQVRQTGNRIDAALRPVELPGFGPSLSPSPPETLNENAAAALESAGENLFGGRLGALKGSRPLSRRLDIRIERVEAELSSDGGAPCTLALQQMSIPVDGSDTPAHLSRVVVRNTTWTGVS